MIGREGEGHGSPRSESGERVGTAARTTGQEEQGLEERADPGAKVRGHGAGPDKPGTPRSKVGT